MLSEDSSSSDDDKEVDAIIKTSITIAREYIYSNSDTSDSTSKWGGSRPSWSPNIKRDFSGANDMLIQHYFSGEETLYNEESFERRFGSPRRIILCVYEALHGHDPFVQKVMRHRQLGIRPLV